MWYTGDHSPQGGLKNMMINIECLFSFRFVDCAMRLHTNEMYVLYRTKLIGHLIGTGSAPPTTSARHCNAVSRL